MISMQPGQDLIIECPHCQKKFRERTIMSGNTFGAVSWTDGREEAPMLPEGIIVSFCGQCNKYFWVEEAKIIDRIDPWEKKEPECDFLEALSLEQYIDALEKIEIRSDQDTLFLLHKIWWKYNDYYREDKEQEIPENIKKVIPELLDELLKYFNEDDNEHLLLKGELLRELGQFKAAEKTLNKVSDPEYKEVKEFIIELAQNETSELRQLEI